MKPQTLVIPFEKKLREDIFSTLKGDIITKILEEAKTDKRENVYKHLLEGYSFKLSPEISEFLYNLIEEVRKSLEFDEKVDYYIDNSAESNAYCITKDEDDESHILVLHSRLIETMSEDELKFVIGHEFGHLINDNNKIKRVVDFVFTGEPPLVLHHKLKLWNKLSELTADRYGLTACGDVHTAISVFLKLTSGLDPEKISLNMDVFMKENIEKVNELKQNDFISNLSHPVNPARIKALDLFSRSELYKHCKNPEINKAELIKETDKLIDILEYSGSDGLDIHRKMFIATGGLIAASCDQEVSKEEYRYVLDILSGFTTFPEAFLNAIVDSEKTSECFEKSVSILLDSSPSEKYSMFNFFIDIVMMDHDLKEKEIKFLYDFGQDVFGFSKKETAQRIADKLRERFVPDVFKL